MTDNELRALIALLITIAIIVGFVTQAVVSRRRDRGALRESASESDARLERLEQAVDAIAIEVERISEGQRFAAKLLADRFGEPIAAPPRASRESPRAP